MPADWKNDALRATFHGGYIEYGGEKWWADHLLGAAEARGRQLEEAAGKLQQALFNERAEHEMTRRALVAALRKVSELEASK
jgi:hypothetical protein